QAVDWCDAVAYCAWAGKHLCGHVIASQALSPTDAADASAAEWYRACSHAGTRTYPYPGPEADVCAVGADYGGPGGGAPVGSRPGCEGGYPGIFDMSGNVREWVDACESDAPNAFCVAQGGKLDQKGTDGITCAGFSSGPETAPRTDAFFGTGFRCCARLP